MINKKLAKLEILSNQSLPLYLVEEFTGSSELYTTVNYTIVGLGKNSVKLEKETSVSQLKFLPTRGYSFVGWYKDSQCTQKYNTEDIVTAQSKIYAKSQISTYAISFKQSKFLDIKTDYILVNYNQTFSFKFTSIVKGLPCIICSANGKPLECKNGVYEINNIQENIVISIDNIEELELFIQQSQKGDVMTNKKLSVLVPVYNGAKYLKRCLNSLKNQTYKNIEIIIVNDASTDESLDIISLYQKQMPNITVINHTQNKGLFLARVTGLFNCTGEYIAFLDCDDFVDDNFYETYMNIIVRQKADLCMCDFKNHFADNDIRENIINVKEFELLGEECFNAHCDYTLPTFIWTKLIHRRLFDRSKQHFEEIQESTKNIIGGEETIFSTIFISKAQKIVNGTGSYYYYCRHEDQSVVLDNVDKFLAQVDSNIRANKVLRKWIIKNDLYSKYYNLDIKWINFITQNYLIEAIKLKSVQQFNTLLDKYGYRNIKDGLKVLSFVLD